MAQMKLKWPLFLKNARWSSSQKIKLGEQHIAIVLVGPQRQVPLLEEHLFPLLAPWQRSQLQESSALGEKRAFETPCGPLNVILFPERGGKEKKTHGGLPQDSSYTQARDKSGQAFWAIDWKKTKSVSIHALGLDRERLSGLLVGLEMAAYQFKEKASPPPPLTLSYEGELSPKEVQETYRQGMTIGEGVNLARHLVNLPPAAKRPYDYARGVQALFSEKREVKVTLWDQKRLKKEGMGLMLGVGGGSVQGPHLVHIRYRPGRPLKGHSPIAFVGKGITFDTGGLNLKPGNSMRLMKKDMGGSAALVGLAHWVIKSKLKIPCDFYLPLAENSVDAASFRPSDILKARNGLTVEIDNTDAEGRLVLGDALALAAESKGPNRPRYLIDVATLTGAIKVGLGSDIGGLFSNDDPLAQYLQTASEQSGDPLWRMPLMPSQRKKLKSDFADLTNSANGFGGAIRAAMFLQEFTGDIPWAHLDIYAWNDSPQGPFSASGGSGQGVQCLIQFLTKLGPSS